jgi:hypothetical protein
MVSLIPSQRSISVVKTQIEPAGCAVGRDVVGEPYVPASSPARLDHMPCAPYEIVSTAHELAAWRIIHTIVKHQKAVDVVPGIDRVTKP